MSILNYFILNVLLGAAWAALSGQLTLENLAAGYAIGGVLNEGINSLVSALTGSQTTLGAWIYDLIHGSEEAEAFGLSVEDSADRTIRYAQRVLEASRATSEAAGGIGELADESERAGGGMAVVGDAAENNRRFLEALKQAATATFDEAAGVWRDASGALIEVGENAQRVKGDAEGLHVEMRDGKAVWTIYEKEAVAAAEGVAKAQDEAAKHTEAYLVKMAELASQERIATIEAKVELDIASMENATKQIEAAFASLNTTIESTGDVMVGILDKWNPKDLTLSEQSWLQQQYEAESRRRDQALRTQQELARAQVRYYEAKSESLQRGDALITITGDGLAPHLEAFMWEVLRAVQVRVNEDGLDMLLGMNG